MADGSKGLSRIWLAAVVAMAVTLALMGPAHSQQPAPAARNSGSRWIQAERDRFQAWLANHPADVLIAPFQVEGAGFDPVERTLMATQLADTLAATTTLSIADPVMASRAVGEGLRNFADSDLQAVAKKMQARFVVIGSTGHDQQATFHIRIRVLKQTASGAWQDGGSKSWESIALSDERPPHLMVPTLAPAVADLLLTKSAPQERRAVSVGAPGQLSGLRELLSARRPVNVHVAQLLAICYPRKPETNAERAWIRSLRLAKAAPASADQRLAVARALFHLDRRPAALTVLGEPKTAAELALRAVLDGNLLDAVTRSKGIADPVLRLLAQVEMRDLRVEYETEEPRAEIDTLQARIPAGSDWVPFLQARLENEGGHWGGEGFVQSLARFDALIGTGDMIERGTKEIADGAQQRADPSLPLASTALATYDGQIRSVKAAPGEDDTLRWLLLDLLQAEVVAELVADGRATITTRDQPDEGHKLLARQAPLLRGHPDFEAMEAGLAWREYARWRGEQRAKWQAIALARIRDAYAFAGRATDAIDRAESRAPWTVEVANELRDLRYQSFWDWPVKVSLLSAAVTEDGKAMHWFADRASKYAVTEYPTLLWLTKQELLVDRKAVIEKSLEGRFDASPEFTIRRAGVLLHANDIKGAEAVLRRYVDARLHSFNPYDEYLHLLVSQGRHSEGYKMFLNMPAFDPQADTGRVALSNFTGMASNYFWDIGKFEYAVPLIERSAAYESGSAISISSTAREAIWRRDPDRAAKFHMEAARRYSDLGELDEYFKLIFALGRAEEAWQIYAEVYRDGNGGRVLGSIARHARQIGWTDTQVMDWLATPKNAALADGTFFYAPRAALSAAVIDRKPADLPGLLARFATPSPYTLDRKDGKILRRQDPSAPSRARPEVCGPSRYGNGPVGGMAKVVSVDSNMRYFAQGYQALARNQYADAFAAFDAAARLFEAFGNNCEMVSFMLPYLAISAAHTGNTQALRDYLPGVAYRDRNVNYNLVLAVLAAFDARHTEAEGYLEAALNRWTGNRYQVLPVDFIYADVLEKLYEHTKHPGYRNRLVAFARVRQRVAPSDAWAYAKEYRYSTVATDRVAALGMALYLDPSSATLSGVSAGDAAAAREQVRQQNPFLAWRAAR
jgi:hypothetical protein